MKNKGEEYTVLDRDFIFKFYNKVLGLHQNCLPTSQIQIFWYLQYVSGSQWLSNETTIIYSIETAMSFN